MRVFMEQYAEMLTAGFTGMVLAGMIAASGMFSLIGKRLEAPVENYREYQEYKNLQELCDRAKPDISCRQERSWKAGEWISIEDAFEAVDSQGQIIPVKVLQVWGTDGESVLKLYQKKQHAIRFLQGGIYIFEIQAKDKENKTMVKRIALSVDNRQVET